jgi:hypothetical protein
VEHVHPNCRAVPWRSAGADAVCAEHYRAMAFAQLTYWESLRDIESCLSVQTSKLYSMGFRDPVRRSTLADANGARDWRIYGSSGHPKMQ